MHRGSGKMALPGCCTDSLCAREGGLGNVGKPGAGISRRWTRPMSNVEDLRGCCFTRIKGGSMRIVCFGSDSCLRVCARSRISKQITGKILGWSYATVLNPNGSNRGLANGPRVLERYQLFLMHRHSWIPPPCNMTADWRQLLPTKKPTPCSGLVNHDMTAKTGERLLIEPHPVQTKENYI